MGVGVGVEDELGEMDEGVVVGKLEEDEVEGLELVERVEEVVGMERGLEDEDKDEAEVEVVVEEE